MMTHLLRVRSAFVAGGVLSALMTGCGGGDGPAIKAQPQTLQFGATPVLPLNGTATVAATSSASLAVTYSSLTATVCSVQRDTGKVTALAAGTCTLAADQEGNDDFAPAAQVTQSLVVLVDPKQTIQFAAPPALTLYGTASVKAAASSGLPVNFGTSTPQVCTVVGNTGAVTAIGAGLCTITANQPGDASYQAAPQVTQSITVTMPVVAPAAPDAPTGVAATAGALANSVLVSFIGPANSGGAPITGYTVVSVPVAITASGSSSPIAVPCPVTCTGYAFAVRASNRVGPGAPSTPAEVITQYKVAATFFEPDTQPNDTIFNGSFVVNSTTGSVSDLKGTLTESMTGPPMTTVPLTHQLSAISDGQGGLLVTTFALNTTNTFSEGGFAANSEGLYYGWPNAKHPGAPGGIGNSFMTIYVRLSDPTAPLSAAQINLLAYGDCAAGGMMGDTCMTGYRGRGTMGGYPVSQTISRP